MNTHLPVELVDLVAQAALSTYKSLPPNGKPKARTNGASEWTVLAGICLCERTATDWTVRCISLGTGLKVLPHARLPPHGDVLHDSHAEVIARRGFILWLYDELEKAMTGDSSSSLEATVEGGWALKGSMQLAMYVSTLPCGDASTYMLSLSAPAETSISNAVVSDTSSLASTLSAVSLGLHTTREDAAGSVHRGRIGYSSYSTLRTKPGRLDSPPTTSHSCSDKLAMWSLVGLQGGLLASKGLDVPLDLLVVGGVSAQYKSRVEEEVRRAVGGRLEGWHGPRGGSVKTPSVAFTDLQFEGARDVVAKRDDVQEASVRSCPESLSFVATHGTEVLVNGTRQGAKVKRKEGLPLGSKSRSRLCKLSLYERFAQLNSTLGLAREPGASYFAAKRVVSSVYPTTKEAARSADAPLHGWLVSGKPWESFDLEGRLQLDDHRSESAASSTL